MRPHHGGAEQLHYVSSLPQSRRDLEEYLKHAGLARRENRFRTSFQWPKRLRRNRQVLL